MGVAWHGLRGRCWRKRVVVVRCAHARTLLFTREHHCPGASYAHGRQNRRKKGSMGREGGGGGRRGRMRGDKK